jgi:hypothetical protein
MFNKDVLLTVAEDLEYFQKDIWTDQPQPIVIRHASAILRRLLFDDAIGRTWRALGMDKQPRATVMDLENSLHTSAIKRDDVVVVLALDFE